MAKYEFKFEAEVSVPVDATFGDFKAACLSALDKIEDVFKHTGIQVEHNKLRHFDLYQYNNTVLRKIAACKEIKEASEEEATQNG